jgi:hypothetical protein
MLVWFVYELSKVYRWRSDPERCYEKFATNIFLGILQIATSLVNANNGDASYDMLYTIVKSYRNTIHIRLFECLIDQASVVPWGSLFLQVIDLPLPPFVMSINEEHQSAAALVKAKKCSFFVLNRLFSWYDNSADLVSKTIYANNFADLFLNNFSAFIIKVYLH